MSEQKYFMEKSLPYFNSLYRSAIRFTDNTFDAEDLVQDTLLQAYKNFNTFEDGTNLNAWLHKILHNLYVNQYLSKKKESLNVSLDNCDNFYIYREAMKKELDPEEVFLKKIETQDIESALNLLSETFKQIIMLRDIEGFSYKEIESILNLPEGTVKSKINRARKSMRKNLFNFKTNQVKTND